MIPSVGGPATPAGLLLVPIPLTQEQTKPTMPSAVHQVLAMIGHPDRRCPVLLAVEHHLMVRNTPGAFSGFQSASADSHVNSFLQGGR